MRLTSNFLLLILLYLYCGEDSEKPAGYLLPLTDVMEFELSFGAENVKDEYLLVEPNDIAVDSAGNIYVADENRIKVFESNGKEKTIIGREGQGPGEFSTTPRKVSINDSGLLTALYGYSDFSLFAANNKFIRKIQIQNEQLYIEYKKEKAFMRNFSPENIYSLNEPERIVTAREWKELRENQHIVEAKALLYEKADTLIEIAQYAPDNIKGLRVDAAFETGQGIGKVYGLDRLYELYAAILPKKHVAYTHSFYDAKEENDEFTYIIHIVNLENLQKYQISWVYQPVDIQKELSSGRYTNRGEDFLKGHLKHMKYLPSLISLHCDQDLLFAVHNTIGWANIGYIHESLKEGETIEFLTDIFDVETFTYLRSAYFPVDPDIIKNGYAYRRSYDSEGFAVIEKYKIDPAVYGK